MTDENEGGEAEPIALSKEEQIEAERDEAASVAAE